MSELADIWVRTAKERHADELGERGRRAYQRGYNDALEQAAKMVEEDDKFLDLRDLANDIRALKGEAP